MIPLGLVALVLGGVTAVADSGPDATVAKAKRGTKIKVEKTAYGRAVVNGAGQVVYLFDLEDSTTPECYGDCAHAWPPVLTRGRPIAGEGIKAGKLGTTKRNDGQRQVTYAGHPLYYYIDDTPDEIRCQSVVEFGGTWLLVHPSGTALR